MDGNNTTRTNLTGNDLEPLSPPVFDKFFRLLIVSIMIIIIVAAVCGNLLVCVAILLNKRLRKTTNYFIFSLAISDLMTAFFSMPFDVEALLHPYQWSFGEFICNFWAFMYLIAAPTSILNLMAVSLDRYLAISAPLKYYSVMKPKLALLIIATIWLYSLTFTTAGMVRWPFYEQSVMLGMCFFNISPYYSVVSSAVNFILPTVIMCIIYFHIYKIASAHARRIAKQEVTTSVASNSNEDSGTITSEKKRIKKNIKAAKTIAIIVSSFLLCWMPLTLTSTVGSLCKECLMVNGELWMALIVLAYMNSAMNPILYSFFNQEFRESFKKLFKLQFTRFR
ncbi:hypothetical protein ACROYT_G007334 [Oculina patagonica]